MRQKHRLIGDALDHAGFARRHLAHDRDEHRLAPVGDRRHLHRHVEIFERHIAVAFPERPFRLQQVRVDEPLDDDLGVGRHFERHRHCAHHRIGKPASAPATAISSRSIASFCAPVKAAAGAQPITIAHGIGCFRARYFCQCR